MSKLSLPDSLIGDLRQLIDGARQRVAHTVNHEVVLLYWHVGCRIHADVLGEQRAAYGKDVVQAVAAHLQPLYGRGFDKANLHRMVQMARLYPDAEKVVTLSRQLSWSHFLALLPLDDPLARDYYGEMCRVEGWSVRTLRDKINSMLYQRTALSRKPEQLICNELDTLHSWLLTSGTCYSTKDWPLESNHSLLTGHWQRLFN